MERFSGAPSTSSSDGMKDVPSTKAEEADDEFDFQNTTGEFSTLYLCLAQVWLYRWGRTLRLSDFRFISVRQTGRGRRLRPV